MSTRFDILVVDDSAVARQLMTKILSATGELDVRVASDPIIAMEKMRARRPDVIVLDLHMPRMDGITFLRQIMRTDPIPVVVCSAHAAGGTERALQALEEGAVDIIVKPALGVREFFEAESAMILETIKSAARAHVAPLSKRTPSLPNIEPRNTASVILPKAAPARHAMRGDVIVAIGASAGGTEAIRKVLERMPARSPPVLIVQHMPNEFVAPFASRLATHASMEVAVAADGDEVLAGRALVSPGDRHMMLVATPDGYAIELHDGPPVSRHKPSLDVLFRSVASAAGKNAIGVILTGMGSDGAIGLHEMRAQGAYTIAQDEASSVVFGMPKEAIARGAACAVVSLKLIAQAIADAARDKSAAP
jgi:two-component system chemotaxis response regulator CheB